MEGKKYLAEAIGTFGLVLIAAGAVVSNQAAQGGLGALAVALAYGLGAYAVLSAVEGSDLNPAVTVAKWVGKKTDTVSGIITIIAQLVGAVIAAYLLRAIFKEAADAVSTGALSLSGGVTTQIAVLIEALLTAILVWTWMGGAGALPVALVYTVGVLVAGTLTGGALNPARAFGPAFAEGFWTNQWVYWVGPLIGAIVAVVVYEYGIGEMNGGKKR